MPLSHKIENVTYDRGTALGLHCCASLVWGESVGFHDLLDLFEMLFRPTNLVH
jgi:hypothetical protein